MSLLTQYPVRGYANAIRTSAKVGYCSLCLKAAELRLGLCASCRPSVVGKKVEGGHQLNTRNYHFGWFIPDEDT